MFSAGGEVRDQTDQRTRFAVIRYDETDRQFVFSARQWSSTTTSHICQLQQGLLTYDDIQSDFTEAFYIFL